MPGKEQCGSGGDGCWGRNVDQVGMVAGGGTWVRWGWLLGKEQRESGGEELFRRLIGTAVV